MSSGPSKVYYSSFFFMTIAYQTISKGFSIATYMLKYYQATMDHLHGLCKTCISQSNYIMPTQNQNCPKCNENPPDIIVNQQGLDIAICAKCYTKELNSPLKRSEYKKSFNSSFRQAPTYQPIQKADLLSKSFFEKEPKMIKKIQKFFAKFQGKSEECLKEIAKKSIVQLPVTWEKITSTCHKTSSLLFLLLSKNQMFGFFHYESIKIGTALDDPEAGFFLSNRTPIDIQFYRPNSYNVLYNSNPNGPTKSICLGKSGQVMQMIFKGNEIKLKCDVTPTTSQWLYFYILKL